MKFHENPFSWILLLSADGRTDVRTDLTKLTVAFSNFAKATYYNVC
jgi:hypothetical protein